MPNPRSQWLHRLHPKRLDPSIGAIAGLASAVSVIVGFIAQNAMGHGWHKASIALHLAKKPLIVRLAPAIAAIAVGIATAAALLRFYNWYREARVRAAARSVEQAIAEIPSNSTRSLSRMPLGSSEGSHGKRCGRAGRP